MSFLAMGPLLGPIISPVTGDYLSQAHGWRRIFWLLAIIGIAGTATGALVMSETHAPPAQGDGQPAAVLAGCGPARCPSAASSAPRSCCPCRRSCSRRPS